LRSVKSDPPAARPQLIDEFLPKLEEWMEHSRGRSARTRASRGCSHLVMETAPGSVGARFSLAEGFSEGLVLMVEIFELGRRDVLAVSVPPAVVDPSTPPGWRARHGLARASVLGFSKRSANRCLRDYWSITGTSSTSPTGC
jgi:hypothetical protein